MLGKVLGKIGLSAKITNIVRSMYVDTRAKYRLEDIETDWVKSKKELGKIVYCHQPFSAYTQRSWQPE